MQPFAEHGFSRVEFGLPELLTRCTVEGKHDEQSCIFLGIDNSSNSVGGSVVWEVPCGKREHAKVVSFLTFVSASLSALLIVLTSIYYSNIGDESTKES